MTESRREVTIIANPISGEGASYHKAELLARRLRRRGVPCRVLPTEHAGHASDLAHEAASDSRAVIAVGGDGTVNEVAHGLAGTDTPLVVMPTGTANVLAHELRVGKHVSAAIRAICHGKVRRMDLGRVTHPEPDPTRRSCFACMASCGYDAAVTRAMHFSRTGKINYAHYVPVMLQAFCDYTYPELSVMLDGQRWPRGVRHVVVSNTRSYGGPFRVATRARFDDSLFDVVLFEKGGPFWLLLYMASLVVRGHFVLPGVKLIRARVVQVSSESPAPYQLDGDFVGHTPLTVELEPKALGVLTTRSERR